LVEYRAGSAIGLNRISGWIAGLTSWWETLQLFPKNSCNGGRPYLATLRLRIRPSPRNFILDNQRSRDETQKHCLTLQLSGLDGGGAPEGREIHDFW